MSPIGKLLIKIILFAILTGELTAQDYDVSEIQCSFSTLGTNLKDLITAKLKKPTGFKGAPLFADDRSVNPETDRFCIIKQDPSDVSELKYDLKISDFTRCGVLKRNGFIHVRIWFPQFPGVVMQSDQELIIMCKPPEPTVIENKAAGFAGSFPNGARVSGVVEETPGRLEYEVALYKEAPPTPRINGNTNSNVPVSSKESSANILNSELPVDQAVPIGTKLQLRARISTQSVWKYMKLMEVTVSPDPENAHADGSVTLVSNGCRNRGFSTIIPHQPARYRDRSNEVFLDFEAFLLSSMKERATLWIHSQIKACMDPDDCQPDFCMDMFENVGVGRKKRNVTIDNKNTTGYTGFNEFLQYTVVMPGDAEEQTDKNDTCRNLLMISAILGLLLAIAISFICTLIMRHHTGEKSTKLFDHYNTSYMDYRGRKIVQ